MDWNLTYQLHFILLISFSFFTGTFTFVGKSVGVLAAGLIISKFKPSARKLAAWNVIAGLITAFGMLSFIFIGCPANDHAVDLNYGSECNSDCHCDFVKYAPVCGESNQRTFISACHAGCTERTIFDSGNNISKTVFENCSCIPDPENGTDFGTATPGSCPIGCEQELYTFLIVMSVINFIQSSGLTSNYLVTVRCVPESDRAVTIGLYLTLTSLLGNIPGPIVFGMILDAACMLWGQTCSSSGNCWIYDGPSLR